MNTFETRDEWLDRVMGNFGRVEAVVFSCGCIIGALHHLRADNLLTAGFYAIGAVALAVMASWKGGTE